MRRVPFVVVVLLAGCSASTNDCSGRVAVGCPCPTSMQGMCAPASCDAARCPNLVCYATWTMAGLDGCGELDASGADGGI